MEDTIVAISTAIGLGAISIIRLSGPDAIKIANKIFKGKDLTKVASHTINYGHIYDGEKIVDEVLVSVMLAPKTYTTEDIVEINTHGGVSATNKVLELCLLNGARLATQGEFTKRAFLAGRIDLTQAEAVQDIITSATDKSLSLFVNQLTGSLKNLIIKLRKDIVSILANIEVNIDYPEYEDAPKITIASLKELLYPVKNKLNDLIKESKNAKIIKDGINIAIIGRPNVGKSSLLNKLLEEEKAIVTDIAGTTRDLVEGSIIFKGIKLNFIDTAGIRESKDIVENIGIKKSLDSVSQSNLVILVLNNNEDLTSNDHKLLDIIKDKTHIVFVNKNDLPAKLNIESLKDYNICYGNTINDNGIDELKNKIEDLFNLEQIKPLDNIYLTNSRQNALIKLAIKEIDHALKSLDEEVPVDLVEIDIKNAWNYLGEIIGATYKEELIDELFSNFCLGK